MFSHVKAYYLTMRLSGCASQDKHKISLLFIGQHIVIHGFNHDTSVVMTSSSQEIHPSQIIPKFNVQC